MHYACLMPAKVRPGEPLNLGNTYARGIAVRLEKTMLDSITTAKRAFLLRWCALALLAAGGMAS
jgi:hypothetical protein